MSTISPSTPEASANGLSRVLSAANPLALDLVQRYAMKITVDYDLC